MISVIIPVYNGEAFIARAVDSALSQEFPDFEVIVIDDGSTDETGRILNTYGGRIHVISQGNHGQAAARNKAAAIARGQYLAFLDADDWWRKDKLKLTHHALENQETAVLAFSGWRQVLLDEIELSDYRYERTPSLEDMFSRRFDLAPSAALMRRSAFERCGGFCEELPAWEDTLLWLLARELGEFIYVDELLMSRRLRASYCDEIWFIGAKKFERIALARFGRRVLPILKQIERDLAAVALQEVGTQLRLGKPAVALRWWLEAARLRPQDALLSIARGCATFWPASCSSFLNFAVQSPALLPGDL